VFDACTIYPHQARTNANDKMTVTDYIFLQNIMHREKMLRYKLCRVVDPSKKVPDLNCELQDRLLDVVDLRQQVPDLRSDGIPPPDMELGHWLTGSMGHLGHLSRPGHWVIGSSF